MPTAPMLLEIKGLSFAYPQGAQKAVDNVTFSVRAGEFVTLCGPSGCGKSTLLRQMKTVLAPHGGRSGEILFDGVPLDELDLRRQSESIGFVQQSPENQIVTDKVWHELAFGLESLGADTDTIRRRVAETASFFGIQTWFHRDVSELSGGQKQLLNLASVMVMQPKLLILDEPTSRLDPIAAGEFLSALGKINRELGTAVIITEQRLEEVFPMSDRVLVMERGRLICDDTPRGAGEALRRSGSAMFLAMPAPMRIWAAVKNDAPCPLTVREGREWLDDYAAGHELRESHPDTPAFSTDEVVLRAEDLWFRYERDAADVVRGVSLKAHRGELLAILGGNGTGKTTTLALLSGLLRPYRGRVTHSGAIGVLPQNPQTLFVKKTVREDLADMLRTSKLPQSEMEQRLKNIVALCRLTELLDRHPYDLSGGEQQRAALAKVLLTEPRILLLDEPTKGLDAEFKPVLADILRRLLQRGASVIMVSHDVEFCARYADRCAMFFDGGIVASAPPRRFFAGNGFYTTAANRMARHLLPNAVTAEDVITACGGEIPPYHPPENDDTPPTPTPDDTPPPAPPTAHRAGKLPKRTAAAAAMILLCIPVTIFIGIYCLGDRKYYFISLLVLLECMLPFFLVFEGKKPQARELVTVAVLCAIGVAGRSAFFMLPNFKPVMALVIISGVAFGGETGFLVGAVTMLASNVLFGQGPWTPWQMFSMGIIGFLAGVLFQKGLLRRKRLPLAVFGAVSAVVIYGGIMNTASALMWSRSINLATVAAYCATGLPVDLVHAAATALFLWLLSQPMLEKLERIKLKYGMIEEK